MSAASGFVPTSLYDGATNERDGWRLEAISSTLDMGFYLGTAVLLLAAAAVSWLIVEVLWRRARRRHFWDWQ